MPFYILKGTAGVRLVGAEGGIPGEWIFSLSHMIIVSEKDCNGTRCEVVTTCDRVCC